jgi:hypothetical protein
MRSPTQPKLPDLPGIVAPSDGGGKARAATLLAKVMAAHAFANEAPGRYLRSFIADSPVGNFASAGQAKVKGCVLQILVEIAGQVTLPVTTFDLEAIAS